MVVANQPTGPPSIPHGTPGGYSNHGCRCPACKTAHAQDQARQNLHRQQRAAADPSLVTHGTSGYRNWGCHCDVCREGHAQRMRITRTRRKDT